MYSSWFIFKEERQRAEGSRWFAPGQDGGEPTNVSLLLGFGPEATGLSLWVVFFSSSAEQTVSPHISMDPCGHWLKASFKDASYFSFG